jgi:hypothetical protein
MLIVKRINHFDDLIDSSHGGFSFVRHSAEGRIEKAMAYCKWFINPSNTVHLAISTWRTTLAKSWQ